jgi:hypothetical protein
MVSQARRPQFKHKAGHKLHGRIAWPVRFRQYQNTILITAHLYYLNTVAVATPDKAAQSARSDRNVCGGMAAAINRKIKYALPVDSCDCVLVYSKFSEDTQCQMSILLSNSITSTIVTSVCMGVKLGHSLHKKNIGWGVWNHSLDSAPPPPPLQEEEEEEAEEEA